MGTFATPFFLMSQYDHITSAGSENEYCELRLEVNEEEQWIVVSRFLLTNLFDAAIALLNYFLLLLLLSFCNAPLCRRQLTHSLYF